MGMRMGGGGRAGGRGAGSGKVRCWGGDGACVRYLMFVIEIVSPLEFFMLTYVRLRLRCLALSKTPPSAPHPDAWWSCTLVFKLKGECRLGSK